MNQPAEINHDWQPSCNLAGLRLRAQLLAATREFFALRSVLEVETPLLAPAVGTDPHLAFFETAYITSSQHQKRYLQTSPEFAMKRLLAAGSGSIFQICKAFRNGEVGRFHNPEFTLLEWYRVDYDLSQLMTEIIQLFAWWFAPYQPLLPAESISYQAVFKQYTQLDALDFDINAYTAYAIANQLTDATRLCEQDHSLWLDFLFSHQVQPHLGAKRLTLVYGYPACQAALAKLNATDNRIAERVELFIEGVELGNGYHELCDATEQRARFEKEQRYREQQRKPAISTDEKFLAALQTGLPSCSGIAIGLDRVLMLLDESASINQTLAFSHDRI